MDLLAVGGDVLLARATLSLALATESSNVAIRLDETNDSLDARRVQRRDHGGCGLVLGSGAMPSRPRPTPSKSPRPPSRSTPQPHTRIVQPRYRILQLAIDARTIALDASSNLAIAASSNLRSRGRTFSYHLRALEQEADRPRRRERNRDIHRLERPRPRAGDVAIESASNVAVASPSNVTIGSGTCSFPHRDRRRSRGTRSKSSRGPTRSTLVQRYSITSAGDGPCEERARSHARGTRSG